MDQKITALKVQKRNPNRVNVYLDGDFAFGLARVVAAWLQIGQILTPEKITSLQAQDTHEVAYQKALQLIAIRPRSTAEIQQRLTRHGFDPTVIEATLERLKENRLLDDAAFARLWVENRSTFRPRGRRALALELRQKGIAADAIDDALDESVDDNALALQAAERYARRLQDLDWMAFRTRLSAFLGRRGFDYQTTAEVVRQVWASHHTLETLNTDLEIEEN
ncbi:MAG: RecX family transcriptional regulator [Longilinea sp.]|nr:RecX family transcriptional regulator [Longilinea sp.]